MKKEELKKYEDKLFGLIPVERIKTVDVPRVSEQIITQLKNIEGLTSLLSDVLDSKGINGTISANILKPVISGMKIVGPAVTIRYIKEKRTPDYGYLNKNKAKLGDRDLYAVSEAGDVPVFDANGLSEISVMGGLSATVAKQWGMAGNIVYGGVRDIDEIRKLNYPVWSYGITPRTGKFRVEAIEINAPIMISDVTVHPGDLIAADDTGVVVIPYQEVEDVFEKVMEISKKEESITDMFLKNKNISEIKKVLDPSKW
jgi:4-hydroxy-4-methyl-2-oxoglutarate aldolase